MSDKDTPTQQFLSIMESPLVDAIFDPIINLATKNHYLKMYTSIKDTKLGSVIARFLGLLSANIDNRFKLTEEFKKMLLGNKGSKEKRTILIHIFTVLFDKYLQDWNKNIKIESKIGLVQESARIQKIPYIWKNWVSLREKICPNFNLKFDPEQHDTIKILPDDTLTPKERINRLIEFKDVDRVGYGLLLTHTIAFLGAQPKYNIGGLKQYAYGPGPKIAKMALNSWIRLAGTDFLPEPVLPPLGNPLPGPHSPFYFEWSSPTVRLYEQFLEKELVKTYDAIFDWGLSSLAREISQKLVYRTFLGIKEYIKASSLYKKFFGEEFLELFESYAGSIFGLWDIIPMARSMIPFMKDLRKKPEVIAEVFEFLEPGITELGLLLANFTGAKYLLMGNSRGSSSWISPKLFEEVFWPSMKATWKKINANGMKICAHLDNDWTENMHYFLELPKHSGFFHLDQGDLGKVREIIGDHFCLMGNLQPAITVNSSPEKVYEETKKLIEVCGQEGGFIVSTGCEAPVNIPIENYYAMKRAIIDHGYF